MSIIIIITISPCHQARGKGKHDKNCHIMSTITITTLSRVEILDLAIKPEERAVPRTRTSAELTATVCTLPRPSLWDICVEKDLRDDFDDNDDICLSLKDGCRIYGHPFYLATWCWQWWWQCLCIILTSGRDQLQRKRCCTSRKEGTQWTEPLNHLSSYLVIFFALCWKVVIETLWHFCHHAHFKKHLPIGWWTVVCHDLDQEVGWQSKIYTHIKMNINIQCI